MFQTEYDNKISKSKAIMKLYHLTIMSVGQLLKGNPTQILQANTAHD